MCVKGVKGWVQNQVSLRGTHMGMHSPSLSWDNGELCVSSVSAGLYLHVGRTLIGALVPSA